MLWLAIIGVGSGVPGGAADWNQAIVRGGVIQLVMLGMGSAIR